MSTTLPYLGIDFGTTNSSMAWYNPKTGQAELLRNAEGEEKTPSVVYFGADETLVGTPAIHLIENTGTDAEMAQRVISGIKRHLLTPPVIALPSGKDVRPVEVVATILGKLRRDAEQGHFYAEVRRVVMTCPAVFETLQRDMLREAARLAGFHDVELVEEPVAAAMAFAQTGQQVGQGVLVYDLGGGTFDVGLRGARRCWWPAGGAAARRRPGVWRGRILIRLCTTTGRRSSCRRTARPSARPRVW